jgi:hypothetical protein
VKCHICLNDVHKSQGLLHLMTDHTDVWTQKNYNIQLKQFKIVILYLNYITDFKFLILIVVLILHVQFVPHNLMHKLQMLK